MTRCFDKEMGRFATLEAAILDNANVGRIDLANKFLIVINVVDIIDVTIIDRLVFLVSVLLEYTTCDENFEENIVTFVENLITDGTA